MQYTKNGKLINFLFLDNADLNSQDYREFINSEEYRVFMQVEVADDLHAARLRRIDYYKSCYDFKVLCVKIDGKIFGQSCALKTYAIAGGERIEWWWSVDTFLNSECRGLGIGKNLQKILHEQLPNFSSAWYTPINGIVKKKCGAHGIAEVWFNYYPVSSLITMFIDLSFRKLFHKKFPLRLGIPFLYSQMNSLFSDTKLSDYRVVDVPYLELGEKEAKFMEDALSAKDFHIERSVKFLRWRYRGLKAPYHMLRLEKDGRIEALVSFSEPYNSKFDVCPIKGVTVYDIAVSPTSELTERKIFLFMIKWLRKNNMYCDGIQMLTPIKYLGKIYYPFHSCQILSTLEGQYPNSYLTFADQDLYQI